MRHTEGEEGAVSPQEHRQTLETEKGEKRDSQIPEGTSPAGTLTLAR